jgi:hypothetical protein
MRWLRGAGVGIPKIVRPAEATDDVGPFAEKKFQGELDALDLTLPAVVIGSLAPRYEVGFDVIEPVQNFWIAVEQWATDTSMFVTKWCRTVDRNCRVRPFVCRSELETLPIRRR